MVSRVLSRMIKKAKMRFISGFRIRVRDVTISHLQFVDDTTIFCNADVQQLGYLRCLLRCFEAVSGLKINLAKSDLFQVGEECDIESLAWIFGYRIEKLPSSYLGLPLGVSFKSKAIWEPILERISLRLEGWKVPLLSKGGRLTLIKATLAAMPNYFISLFTIPISMANRIEVMFRKFL